MMNSGVDMFMIDCKSSMLDYINNIKMGVQNKTIDITRLDDAVAKILAVKLAFGLI